MFVVHTVTQLEEALKGSAKEILVIGELAYPVRSACQCKSHEDKASEATEALKEEIVLDINEIFEINGVPVWDRDSMLSLMGNFTVINSLGGSSIPRVILKRIEKS